MKDTLVEILRDEIIRGDLVPGQYLRLEEIAPRFDVSTMPVREALRDLEAEGLVTIFPHRGAIVTKLRKFQASMEERIAELDERQYSIEESLGILKDIQSELEGAHRHWEAFKEKMTVLQGAVEKLVDEFSESLSEEQKEKMKKALNKLFRLWEVFGELVEELEGENRGTKGGEQGEGKN